MNPLLFDSSWRLSSQVIRLNKRDADPMIHSHYLSQWPNNVMLTMGLKCKRDFVGVITYSIPHKKLQDRFGIETWELSRLWINDSIPKNAETFLIGRSIRYIKKEHINLKTLISFADPEHGHSGVIYKASNWIQDEHESKNLFYYPLNK